MNPPPKPCNAGAGLARCRRRAFTMVELMVAMTALLVIGILVVQLMNTITQATTISNRAVDVAAQARLAFDRIGMDLIDSVRRPDADFFARDPAAAANADYDSLNTLIFLSSVPSAGAPAGENRGASLIVYRLAKHPDNNNLTCLVRAGTPIPWTAPASWGGKSFYGLRATGLPVRLSASDTDFPADLLPAASGFDILAPGVIQVTVGYQLYPDGLPVRLRDGSTTTGTGAGTALGQIVYSPPVRGLATDPSHDFIDMSRVAALVVGVVAIDLNSLKQLSATDVDTLAAAFPAPATQNQLPVAFWADSTANFAGLPASVPLPARQAVRTFQRFYPIRPYPEPKQ